MSDQGFETVRVIIAAHIGELEKVMQSFPRELQSSILHRKHKVSVRRSRWATDFRVCLKLFQISTAAA